MNGSLDVGLSSVLLIVSGRYFVKDRYVLVHGWLISKAIFLKIGILGNQYLFTGLTVQ